MPKASPPCGDRQNAPPEWLSNSPLAVTIQPPSCFFLLPLMGEVLRGGGAPTQGRRVRVPASSSPAWSWWGGGTGGDRSLVATR